MASKRTAVAVAMAFVCPAAADTRLEVRSTSAPEVIPAGEEVERELAPSLVLGKPGAMIADAKVDDHATLDRAKLAVRTDGPSVAATLTLALSTRELRPQDIAMTVDVPHGTLATGLAITIGGQRTVGSAVAASDGLRRYHEVVDWQKDPALLELTESTRRHDRLTLHVFPLSKTSSATVEIEMILPALAGLELDPGTQTIDRVEVELDGNRQQWRAVSTPKAIEVPAPRGRIDWMSAEAVPRHVAEYTSLYAAERVSEPVGRVPVVIVGCPHGGPRTITLNKATIRKVVRLNEPRLRHCYMREAQRDPSLAGRVELHFTIGKTGTVSGVGVVGSLPSDTVKACMAEHVSAFEFHASDETVQVTYPLDLVAR